MMTHDELQEYNGQDGKPAYVAVNGKVYDVSDSPHWKNGQHPPDHLAGQDLTEELTKAPHVRAVVERFPVVGSLEEPRVETKSAGGAKIILGLIIALVVIALILLTL